ncbi:helix-turn-helix domain-containing protein [Enemella dayhoffiae]|uniref:helix-turn-helix domain-containing protein n=1 Tax=Enemella dayhoffiae TaxID=2016507 RepID=UPI001E41919D|nr:helix-turn-helix domain-containing protein [Enemella dayhoffiae]
MAVNSSVSPGRGARIVGGARIDLASDLRRRYEAGESIRSMADDLGRSYGFVQGLLKEAGVTLRSRGGATRGAEAVARREATLAAVQQVRAELSNGTPVTATEPKHESGKKAAPDKKAKKAKKSDRVTATATDAKPAKNVKPAKAEKSGKAKKSGKSKKDKKGKKN